MTTPNLKLVDGEVILRSHAGLRRKGIFGNRYGELCVTNQRVTFVKSIMRSGLISAVINAKGARPMLSFDRGAITGVEKVQLKRQVALAVSGGGRTERFVLDEVAIDGLLQLLRAQA